MHCIRFRAGQFFPGWRLENPVGKSDTTVPDILKTAIAPIPGAVDTAQITSEVSMIARIYRFIKSILSFF